MYHQQRTAVRLRSPHQSTTAQHTFQNPMFHFLLPIAECFTHLSYGLGACPSIGLSVTLVYYIKMVQARITKSSLCAAPKMLVYRDKISCSWVRGFPSNEGVKEEYPLKKRYFAAISSSSVKKIADSYKHVAYHNKHGSRAF